MDKKEKRLIRFLVFINLLIFAGAAYLLFYNPPTPDGYVDSYYYCHEDNVILMVEDMMSAIVNGVSLEEGETLIYNESGYAGYPTLEVYDAEGNIVEQFDSWDIVLEYCSFNDGY